MAALCSSSPSSLLFTSPVSKPNSSPSLSPSLRLSSLSSLSYLSSRSFSHHTFNYSTSSRSQSFTIKATASSGKNKKKVVIVNTDSGGHAVIGFYFAKELLGSGHEVAILTVGDEGSDKMKKPPFNRFSEIVSAGGRTVWGDPSEIGKVVEWEAVDVVLDNNGKDLDTVRFVPFGS